jgi:hypothetical protein
MHKFVLRFLAVAFARSNLDLGLHLSFCTRVVLAQEVRDFKKAVSALYQPRMTNSKNAFFKVVRKYDKFAAVCVHVETHAKNGEGFYHALHIYI